MLGQGLVKDAERMREMLPPRDADLRPATDPPGGAGKVAETVDRNDARLVQRRDGEGRGQMSEMVLDGVEARTATSSRAASACHGSVSTGLLATRRSARKSWRCR